MKQMLIRVRPHMKKMAILCEGDPVEIAYSCEECEQTMGNIYKGRVDSVLPGMDAAFVDIGLKRCAFLHFCDCSDDNRFAEGEKKPAARRVPLKVGDEIVVPTIDGKVQYKVPAGTQPGAVFRLKERGVTRLQGRGRGDQYVQVSVEVPKNLTKEQQDLLKKFEKSMNEKNYEKHKNFFDKIKEKLQ